MGVTLLYASRGSAITASGTSFQDGQGRLETTRVNEGEAQVRIPKSGALRNPRILISANTATSTFTLRGRVNGADVGLEIVVPAGQTGEFTSTDEVAVLAGDLFAWALVKATSTGSVSVDAIQADYEPSDGTHTVVHRYSSSYRVSFTDATAAEYASLAAVGGSIIDRWTGSVSASSSDPLYATGQIVSIRANIYANNRNADATIRLLVNGVASGLSVVIPANSGAGSFVASGAVDIAPGDLLTWERDLSGRTSGGITISSLEAAFTSTDGSWDIVSRLQQSSDPANGGLSEFYTAPGPRPVPTATESLRQMRLPEAAVVSHLRSQVYVSSAPGPWPATLRLNGGNTALAVPLPTGGAGSLNPPVVNTTDEVNASAGGLIAIRYDVDQSGSAPTGRGPYSEGVTITAASTPSVVVDVPPGELEITGAIPTVITDEFVTTSPGSLIITGGTPVVAIPIEIETTPGALEFSGVAPSLFLGIAVTPPPGALVITPGAPEVSIFTTSAAISTQQAILAAIEPPSPPVHASQQAILAAGYVIPPVAASQQAILILANAHPCVSRLCQVWLIRRTDGVEFAFTSHDRPVPFIGRMFQPCGSLNPSAVEQASDMASVGNMELAGIISDDGLTEFDLFAGLFDAARVDVWEIPWDGAFPHPIRLASGTVGSVSHGRDGFQGEVLGPGAKMGQQSITQVVTPACHWRFGDDRCRKDLGPLTETGAVSAVAAAAPFRTFRSADLVGSGPEGYFSRGVITWTSGRNEGLRSEVKDYDPATGTVVLWTLLPAPAAAGDAFTITPGCTLAKGGDMGCVFWGNLINFGGFPDVPGDDATAETPVAKV